MRVTRHHHAIPSYDERVVTCLDWRFLPCVTLCLTVGCTEDPVGIETTGPSGSTTTEPVATTVGPVDESTGMEASTTSDGGSSDGSTGPSDDGTTTTGASTTSESGTTGEISVCGNNMIEGAEFCDLNQLGGETCASLGYEGGILGCNLTCDDYNILGCYVCGNGTIDLIEDCEGGVVPEEITCESMGFEGGQILCGGDCLWDTADCSICGDGTRQGPESCDGMDLGGMDCASLGLTGGTLACTPSCGFDPSGCDIPGVPFGSDAGYNGYEIIGMMPNCDDISSTGTVTNLTDDDELSVPIGFTFPVYGVDQTDVTVQSNGGLQFGGVDYMTLSNSCLPSAGNPSMNMLYVFWDDLNPTIGAGEVLYETLGMPGSQRFVIQWDTANYSGDAADLMRFQVVLHEGSGIIDVCYPDTTNAANVGNNGAEATSGIQQDSGSALQYSCNTPDLVDGLQLLYIPI